MNLALITISIILTGLVVAFATITIGPLVSILLGLVFSFISARVLFS